MQREHDASSVHSPGLIMTYDIKMAAGQELSRWPAAVRAARFANMSASFKILSALKQSLQLTAPFD